MRLGRALGLRIVGVALVSALVGLMLMRLTTQRAVLDGAVEGMVGQMRAGEQGRCERAPSGWSMPLPPGLRVYAYDGETGASANPAAPALDRALAGEARGVGEVGVEAARWRQPERSLVVRVAAGGPCALLMARWSARHFAQRMMPGLAVSVAATALVGAGLGLAAVARPLGRRAARLRAQARQVGRGPIAAGPAGQDELSAVEEELVRADERIRLDAADRIARARALEGHLEHVAHDLRTPLTSLQLSVEHALDASHPAEVRAQLDEALRDCIYIAALLDDLRDAARLEGGWDPSAEAVAYDLRASVERVVGRVGGLARRRSVALDHAVPEEPVLVLGDPLGAERVLANLTINAIDHGAAGGHVAVVLRARPGDRFELSVIDDGPGLPPSRLAAAGAAAGDRATSPGRRSGRGQGLTIVQTLCERSGWSLEVEPQSPGSLVRIEGASLPG